MAPISVRPSKRPPHGSCPNCWMRRNFSRRASAQPDDAVAARGLVGLVRGEHRLLGGVRRRAVEDRRVGPDEVAHPAGEAGRHEAAVGHDQGPLHAEVAQELGQARHLALAELDARQVADRGHANSSRRGAAGHAVTAGRLRLSLHSGRRPGRWPPGGGACPLSAA